MDDEMELATRQIQRRSDAEIEALRKEQDKYIEAISARENLTREQKDREIEALRELYDSRILQIRDRTDGELKEQRRAARDRLTAIRDNLDDQREVETSGARKRFEEAERIEEERKTMLIAKAKEAAQESAKAAAEQLAKGLQEDAIGTITEFFERIRQLPKEAQLSTMTAFFGEDARALQPLIQNVELLETALGLVGDKSQYAGSTLEEFKNRMDTAAQRIKVAQGNLEILAIEFGQNFVPALVAAMQALAPILNAFAWLVKNVPLLGPALAIVSAAFVALVAVAPGISAIVSLMGAMPGVLTTIAGLITVVQVAFSGLVTFLTSTILPALIAFFSGPAGWTVLAVAAVVAMAIAFREPLGKFLSWLGEWAGKVLRFFVDSLTKPIVIAWNVVTKGLTEALSKAGDGISRIWNSIANGVKSVARSLLQYIANTVNSVASLINKIIAAYNRLRAPEIPLIPQMTVPQFATGGIVARPTLAMVGEREREYIVPESKMAQASANYLMGARGAAVIPAFANGGVVGGGGASQGNTTIQLNTGPVLQQDGQRYVTIQDLERSLSSLGGVSSERALEDWVGGGR